MIATPTRYRPGIADLARREWYMTRLDWGLRNLPTRENRQILRDLRRDVTATAAEIGMRPALADLGGPGDLAARYTATTAPDGPRYVAGAVAAALMAGAILYLATAYAFGTLDTLVAMGGGTRSARLWGSEFVFVGTAEEISVATTSLLPAFAVSAAACAVAFLLFSRIWRLARRSG